MKFKLLIIFARKSRVCVIRFLEAFLLHTAFNSASGKKENRFLQIPPLCGTRKKKDLPLDLLKLTNSSASHDFHAHVHSLGRWHNVVFGSIGCMFEMTLDKMFCLVILMTIIAQFRRSSYCLFILSYVYLELKYYESRNSIFKIQKIYFPFLTYFLTISYIKNSVESREWPEGRGRGHSSQKNWDFPFPVRFEILCFQLPKKAISILETRNKIPGHRNPPQEKAFEFITGQMSIDFTFNPLYLFSTYFLISSHATHQPTLIF